MSVASVFCCPAHCCLALSSVGAGNRRNFFAKIFGFCVHFSRHLDFCPTLPGQVVFTHLLRKRCQASFVSERLRTRQLQTSYRCCWLFDSFGLGQVWKKWNSILATTGGGWNVVYDRKCTKKWGWPQVMLLPADTSTTTIVQWLRKTYATDNIGESPWKWRKVTTRKKQKVMWHRICFAV